MELKEKAVLVCDLLEKEYPLAECTLSYSQAWQLMVSVRLAAQCTDARVDIVTAVLFKEYPTPEQLANANYDDVLNIVRPCGLGPSKTKDILASMRKLVDEYDGIVPDDLDTLLTFPGVGRKSANLIVGDIYGKPAIVCDTHCIRISNLLGLTENKAPEKVEKDLRAIVPPERGNDLCHRFVLHGRACCIARRPQCEKCCLNKICSYALAKENKQ
ncbi:MAG: endonuclease III [Oscillospiraceae bacterium]|nr:endonuclease III [Oscillospiraceae bacterium]MDO5137285.1 endonuclease III [Oscillospiraceae bacterium]